MTAMSRRAVPRVICKIFIKATPQAVWAAICPASKSNCGYASPTPSRERPAAASPGVHATSARCLCDLITIGGVLEADPLGRRICAVGAAARNAPIRSGLMSVELRDTLTGYTAVTVSCEPDRAPSAQESRTGAYEWDRLLGDLKTVTEAGRRERHRLVPTRSSSRSPHRLRPKLVPQALALSGGLSPD
jgi:hypothetical protein